MPRIAVGCSENNYTRNFMNIRIRCHKGMNIARKMPQRLWKVADDPHYKYDEEKHMNIAVAGTEYVGLSIATLLPQHHHVMAVEDQ